MPIDDLKKVFLLTSGLFLLSSSINVVKTTRDRADSRKLNLCSFRDQVSFIEEKLNIDKETEKDAELPQKERNTSNSEMF